MKKFLFTFKNDLNQLITTANLTINVLDNRNLPRNVANWLNYTKLREVCKKRHKEIKKLLLMEPKQEYNKNGKSERYFKNLCCMH